MSEFGYRASKRVRTFSHGRDARVSFLHDLPLHALHLLHDQTREREADDHHCQAHESTDEMLVNEWFTSKAVK